MTYKTRLFAAAVSLCTLSVSATVSAMHTIVDRPTCTPAILKTIDVFNCIAREELPPVEVVQPTTYLDNSARGAFPQFWHQLGYNQQHNPVFNIKNNAPPFLRSHDFWTTPITGIDVARLSIAELTMRNDEAWGSRTAQYVGNVMGVSAAQGIIYVQLGRHEIWALDAENGKSIWHADLSTSAGMGQTLVQEINGKLVVFVSAGDAGITIDDATDFANGKSHDRGGNFSGMYAFDGVTGKQLWRVPTKGAARPAPAYHDGKLYLATSGGQFIVLDAKNGKELGRFENPGDGIPGLAALNWYKTNDKRVLFIYGTTRPRRIIAVDATNPAIAPTLAWSYTPPNATANSAGDTPVAIDPDLGMVFTTVISSVNGQFTMNNVALDATTGALRWNDYAGGIDAPPGYKGSVPMVFDGVLYVGNTSNGTFRAYTAKSGKLRWETNFAESDDVNIIHRPRAAAVMYDDKLIIVEGHDIHTLDPKTGAQLNLFETPGSFARWGIDQPTIIGNRILLSSISGWVFSAPVDLLTSLPGFPDDDAGALPDFDGPLPRQQADLLVASALPSDADAAQFPDTWLAFDGGQEHNGVSRQGPAGIQWQTALNDALPLNGPAMDESLYGAEVATHMTHLAVGVGSAVTPVNGIVYAGSNRFSIYALNALTGEPIWRFRTINANMGQPLVTPTTVVVSGGDLWMNLNSSGKFKANSPDTIIGDSFPTLHGLDPKTGAEKWTFYSGNGTSAMTPLYNNGNLYWVNGESKVWAIDAELGLPIPEFFTVEGVPSLNLGGFNAISSANIYHDPAGRELMIVGTGMPNNIWAIDLETAAVAWSNGLSSINTEITGFSTVSPAVDQNQGLVIGTVITDVDTTANTVNVLAYALDAKTGMLAWTQNLGSGTIPSGFTSPTPLLDSNSVYIYNPLSQSMLSLNSTTGAVQWTTTATAPAGKLSWGAGVIVNGQVVVPVGPALYTFDSKTGTILGQYSIGGSMTYNSPTVVGETLYVGNSFGTVSAIPLNKVVK